MGKLIELVRGYIHSATSKTDLDHCAECGSPANDEFIHRGASTFAYCSEKHYLDGVATRAF